MYRVLVHLNTVCAASKTSIHNMSADVALTNHAESSLPATVLMLVHCPSSGTPHIFGIGSDS